MIARGAMRITATFFFQPKLDARLEPLLIGASAVDQNTFVASSGDAVGGNDNAAPCPTFGEWKQRAYGKYYKKKKAKAKANKN